MYYAIKSLKENKHVNIVGERGSGKTHLAKEVACYLNFRNCFKGGFFYFDLLRLGSLNSLVEEFNRVKLTKILNEIRVSITI